MYNSAPGRAQGNEIQQRLRLIARALRRRRRLRLAVRATWLALGVWSVGLLLSLVGLRLPPALLGSLVGATLVTGLAFAWLSHPSLLRLARGLDSHYRLSQQLSTALEVAQQSSDVPLEARLLRETEDLLVRMRRYLASRPLVPWRELETFAAVLLLTIGLTIAAGPLLPEASAPVDLPSLPPPAVASESAAPMPSDEPVAEEQPQAPLSPDAAAAADAIADALRDNGATRSAADALDRGDTASAASELRELADQADQLSEQAREELAEGLRSAADRVRERQPGLADQLERQADALEQGGQESEQALEDLARTVEQLSEAGEQVAQNEQTPGEQGQSEQGEGEGAGSEASAPQPGSAPVAGSGNQLGGEQRGAQDGGVQAQGETLPLPQSSDASGPSTNATGPRGPSIQLEAGGTGAPREDAGNRNDQPLAGEADPLTIPSEYRDVVEEYFSPQP